MAGPLEFESAQYRQQLQGQPNYLEMFTRSLMGSAGGLLGIEKPVDVQLWDRQHPVAAMIGEFGMPLGYYGGALKAARIGALGKYGKWVDTVAESRNPILRYGAREALRIAPIEGLRIAASAAVPGGDVDETAMDVLLGTAISAGIGSGFGALEAAGKAVIKKFGGVYDGSRLAPPQVQIRDLRARIPNMPEADRAQALTQLRQWENEIVQERPRGTKVLFRPLEQGDSKALERLLFKPKASGEHYVRYVSKGSTKAGRFATRAELDHELGKFDLADDWLDYAQHPRHVRPQTAEATRKLETTLAREMKPIGKDAWITKEADDGLYVVAMRNKTGDGYLSFKTDDAKRFLGDGGWLTRSEELAKFLRQPTKEEQTLMRASSTLTKARQFRETVPIAAMADIAKPNSVVNWAKTQGKNAAQFYGYGVDDGAAETIGNWFRQYVAPAARQFKVPAAKYAFSGAKALFEITNAKFVEAMVGTRQLTEKGLMWAVTKGLAPKGGAKALIESLDDEDMALLTRTWRLNQGPAEAEAAGGSENLIKFLKLADAETEAQTKEILALQKLTGRKEVDTKLHHMGIQRTYRGDWFVPVMEGRKLVGIAGGDTVGQAQKEAQRIIAKAAEEGRTWVTNNEAIPRGGGDNRLFSLMSLDPEDWKIVAEARDIKPREARTPITLGAERESTIEAGFVGAEKPFTKQELEKIISHHWQQNYRYIAELSWRHEFDDLIRHIAATDPNVGMQLEQRINDLVGIKNDFSRFQDKLLDGAVGRFVGPNSATRLVRGLNSMQMHLNFGAMNLSFPFVQTMSFLQQVMPEVAMVLHGAPEHMKSIYSNWVVGGADGLPRAVVGVFEPWKAQARAFKALKDPVKQFGPAGAAEYVGMLNELIKSGTLEPHMIDEFLGDNATMRGSMREIIGAAKNNPWGWLKDLNLLLVNMSDRFSRAHAATVAYDIGKNAKGFQGEQLLTFMKEFTDRTMYGYSVADRSRMFTGPLGSAFGMFKNWQVNYLYQLMDYAHEGIAHGNWKPLLWSFTGSAVLGGLPATGGVYALADGMSRLFADESLMELWYDNFNRDPNGVNWSDAIFLGLPAFLPPLVSGGYIPGVTFAGQAATPFSDPSRDISMLMNFVYWDRIKATGDFGEALSMAKGNVFSNEQVLGTFLRAFAPKTVYRSQQVIGEGIINSSRTIYPTQSGLTGTEQLLYALGFNPSNVELGYRAQDELWADQEYRLKTTQALGASWAEAELSGDWSGLDKIVKQSIIEGIDLDKVLASARARKEKASVDLFQRQFPAQQTLPLQSSGILR